MYRNVREIRFLPAAALAGVVSFALFLLMHQMVATNQRPKKSVAPPVFLGSVKIQRPPPVSSPRRPQSRKPKPATRPRSGIDTTTVNPAVPRTPLAPRLSFAPGAGGLPGWSPSRRPGGGNTQTDNASPMLEFAIKPLYPPDAEYQGVEGSLRTCFTVTADGSVVDPRIAGASSSEARRLFGPYALRTILQWKYFPRRSNGVAVATPDVCATIQFKLRDVTDSR